MVIVEEIVCINRVELLVVEILEVKNVEASLSRHDDKIKYGTTGVPLQDTASLENRLKGYF